MLSLLIHVVFGGISWSVRISGSVLHSFNWLQSLLQKLSKGIPTIWKPCHWRKPQTWARNLRRDWAAQYLMTYFLWLLDNKQLHEIFTKQSKYASTFFLGHFSHPVLPYLPNRFPYNSQSSTIPSKQGSLGKYCHLFWKDFWSPETVSFPFVCVLYCLNGDQDNAGCSVASLLLRLPGQVPAECGLLFLRAAIYLG